MIKRRSFIKGLVAAASAAAIPNSITQADIGIKHRFQYKPEYMADLHTWTVTRRGRIYYYDVLIARENDSSIADKLIEHNAGRAADRLMAMMQADGAI